MSKISAEHLARQVCVYVRQSTLEQVHNNLESQRRQCVLSSARASSDDSTLRSSTTTWGLGRSAEHRGLAPGAQRARRHPLLEFCCVVYALLIGADGIYDPAQANDRLLLGMKGAIARWNWPTSDSARTRPPGAPEPLPYLNSERNRTSGSVVLQLEVRLQTEAMARSGPLPERLSHSIFVDPGPARDPTTRSAAATSRPATCSDRVRCPGRIQNRPARLFERTVGGRRAIELPSGEHRTFLEDGDTVILRAQCERNGARHIGFGECAGALHAPTRAP
ncbi:MULTISPECIES: hypothetical protein [Comamonadaceae]|uniref:hypothetical protein n=1 Tax=Comamonadaceae TaxID=80864 RepID=UPI0005704B2D|nr:hypothetical protein [Xenophilus azovorans]MBU1771081.1 hypothetical protein [Alphaproteobacteria bacterium]